MLIFKNTIKQLSILLCTLFITITNMYLPVYAANKVTVSKQIPYSYRGVNTTSPYYSYWGEIVRKINADGQIAFCVQPEQELIPSSHFTVHDFSSAQKTQIENIAYAGWHLSNKSDDDYAATQFMIWEAMGMKIESTSFSNYANKKAEINKRLQLFDKFPSFKNESLTLKVGEAITLTDSNGVFENYYFTSSSGGVTATKAGNKLTITANASAPEKAEVTYQLVKKDCVGTSIIYASDNSQDVAVFKRHDPKQIKINIDVQKYGKVQITKRDESSNKIVQREGVEYEIHKAADNSLVSTITSNDKGIAESGLLLFGDYYYIETKAPEKYLVNSTPHYFTISKAFVTDEYTDSSISDVPVKAKSTITKEDKETGDSAQGDATLEGAVYGFYAGEDIEDPAHDGTIIYHKDELVSSHTIKNGKATATTDYLGKYYWLEDPENASKGYLPDPQKHEVNLLYQDQVTPTIIVNTVSHEQVKKQAFQIEKLESSGTSGELPPLADAEFTYILKSYVEKYGSFDNALNVAYANDGRIKPSEWGRMVTDDNGYAKSKELPFGKYVVKETVVPKDHNRVDDFEINISEDNRQPQRMRFFEDKTFNTKLAVVKQDKETGNTVALSGMRFKVKALTKTADFEAGEYVGYWAWNPLPHYVNEWTTSEDGTVMLEMSLKAGTYQIEEIETPEGYLMNHEPLIFKITAGWHQQVGPDDMTMITTVIFKDQPVKGQVKVDKQAELFKGYQSEMTEYGELFTPVYEKGLLAGAKFAITAKTDIIGVDGTVWYHAGDMVETLISDGEDVTVSTLLPIGSEGNNIYSLQEVETAEGYVVDPTVRDFRFDYVDDETEVVTPTWLDENGNEIEIEDTLTLNNEKQTAIAVSSKVMETSIFDHENAYKNVIFGVFADEVEGLEKDSLVGLSGVDDEGNIDAALSQAGSYYLQEVATDKDYVLDNTKYPFTYKYKGDKIHTITVNDGVIKNKLKRATLEIIKYTEDELIYSEAEKAELGEDNSNLLRNDLLKDERNYLAFSEFELSVDEAFTNVIATGVTDRDGRLVFDGLELGTYFVREKNSAEFYEINDEIFSITLSREHQVETIEVKNDLKPSYVEIMKVDYYQPDHVLPLTGFTMYEDEACTKELETIMTNDDGISHFDSLEFGTTVYIKESEAPKGYEISDEVVKVEVNEDWVKGDKAAKVIHYADRPITPKRVNTGDHNNMRSLMSLGWMSLAVMVLLGKKERTSKEKKDDQ